MLLTTDRRPWAYDAAADRPAEDAAFALVSTSGTTGRPKASRLVHRCAVHSAMSYAALLGLEAGERTLVSFPLYYVSALHAHVLPAMLVGATSVLTAFPSPREFVAVLARERVSWAYAVPAFWQMVLRTRGLDGVALPALRRVGLGGSAFPPGMEAALRDWLPGVRLHDVYGLSETHSPATMLLDHEFAAKAGSIGRPLPCMEARVVDDAGAVLPVDQPGELHLRGALVTTGYAGDDAATAEAIRDGWFATGDVAQIDADGYVWILDRVKDMVYRGGAKVFSAEVERVLRALPEIADAGVVGTADGLGGEVVSSPSSYRRTVPRSTRARCAGTSASSWPTTPPRAGSTSSTRSPQPHRQDRQAGPPRRRRPPRDDPLSVGRSSAPHVLSASFSVQAARGGSSTKALVATRCPSLRRPATSTRSPSRTRLRTAPG